MKKLVIASAVVFGMAGQALAEDPCQDAEGVVMNRWLVSLNKEDASSKEDILDAIRLMGKGGFQVRNFYSYPDDNSITASFSFSPDYYYDQDQAKEVKNNVLGKLVEIDGVKIYCDSIVYPTPAIGVRSL